MKGYTYQQSIFILFLAVMDTQRSINKIIVEATDTKQFDDLYIETINNEIGERKTYRIQVKNYPGTTAEDISITDHYVTIKRNTNEFDPKDNNILIVNSTDIRTDTDFMGFPALKKGRIIIIPMTPDECAERFDDMFSNDARALQIIHQADEITQNASFEISIRDLPKLISMSIDMEEDTIFLRKAPENIPEEITLIEGKPGVGKSHFVNELCEKYPDAIVYRFWTGSQDPFINERIRFERFLIEMGIKVYDSPKKVIIEELIKTIKKDNKIIIIDGLDHVENYNYSEINRFIGFINQLQGTRCIVLTRPTKTVLPWNKINLLDWSFEETQLYLELQHHITDSTLHSQIFEYTNGYPIITRFIAQDYLINKRLNLGDTQITSIDDYYNGLFINGEKPSSVLCVFAAGHCFFTWNELKNMFKEPELFEIVKEFVSSHPYLFKIIRNRVSLIHDSFNTFIRTKLPSYSMRKELVLGIVRESLLNGSVEYMDRMKCFSLDDDFYRTMIKKYTDFAELNRLMQTTRDYNSISSLYNQLRYQLEKYDNLLDIYQLYTFALLYQVTQRNDLIGSDSLVYQLLRYMKSHDGIENHIFSNGYLWNVYLLLCGEDKSMKRYLENMHYSESQYDQLLEIIDEDCHFYEKKETIIKLEEIIEIFNSNDYRFAYEVLADYFVSLWIHGDKHDRFYEEILSYIDGNNSIVYLIWESFKRYNVDLFNVRFALSRAKYILHELGYFEDGNRFRNRTLESVIREGAVTGSFTAVTFAASYLKLANHENRDVDIESLAYAWSMYYQKRDYSVHSIDTALIAFEEKGFIDEDTSFEIIEKLQNQSEKGISHLATQYVNAKSNDFINKLRLKKYFSNDTAVSFWELNPDKINCFSDKEFIEILNAFLQSHMRVAFIMYHDLEHALKSKYKNIVLDGVMGFGFSIISPEKSIIDELEKLGINYIPEEETTESVYVPFKGGYIHEEDYDYIQTYGISCLEVAKYADGWYTCFPFVNVFDIYSVDEIQEKYLEIVKVAMFARCSNDTYLGNWYKIIGNVIEFLLRYSVDVDFSKLYQIFSEFLDVSLIWHRAIKGINEQN